MVDYFEDLTSQSTDQDIPFRICFSSRHYPYIVPRYGKRLILEYQSGHSKDLETYIKSRLRIRDAALMDELQLTLLTKSAGVFMWVVLVVDILNKEYQRGGLALRRRIAEIPSDLSELFKDILRRDGDNMEQLLFCIRWILFSQRPLRPVEFHLAVWSGLSLRNLVDNEIPVISSPESERLKAFVIGSSKGLAEITKSKTPTVQFIHESVRDFLIKDHGLYQLWPELESEWQSSGHDDLKQCCHMYLNHPSVLKLSYNLMTESKSESRAKKRADVLDEYPFLEYASQHVLDHSDAADETISQEDFLSHFPLLHWIKMNNLFEKFKTREYSGDGNLFYILADKGCSNLIRTRTKRDPQVHSYVPSERYEYPLFAALASCNKNTVATLLNVASSVADGTEITDGLGLKHRKDFTDFKGHTPLTWAARHGRLGILKLLLEAGLDVNQTDREGSSALSRAWENCHEAAVFLLIQNGANLNSCNLDFHGMTALTKASMDGYEALVRLLIEDGAMTTGDDDGGLALLKALEYRREAIAALLIENGANINARDSTGMSPISHASSAGCEALVRLLIDSGVMANGNDEGLTLIHAVRTGHQEIAALLIENGANLNARDSTGMSPVSHASSASCEALVRLLIDSGVMANGDDGGVALILASQYGHEAVVRILIDHGADVNTVDKWKNTSLSLASQYGHEAVVKLLIENKADVNTRNELGYTPLVMASHYGQGIVERLLIENGAVVNTIDSLDELRFQELWDEAGLGDNFFQ